MKKSVRLWPAMLLAWAIAASAAAGAVAGADVTKTPVEWHELQFEARKLGLSAKSVVERQSLHSSATWKLAIDSSYVGRSSSQELIFDPQGRLLFDRSWRASGSSSYMNERLYLADSIWRHRRAPRNKVEAEQGWSAWTDVAALGESYPLGSATCTGFADTAVVLHFLPALEKIPADVCFLADDSLWRLEIEELGTESVEVEIADSRGGTEVVRKETLELRKIAIRPILRHGAKKSDFELLGLRGDLIALLHPEEGYPIRFLGHAPVIGKLTVSLTSIR